MSKIVFFSIPAYGHTNPTVEVVRELTSRGHQVWYYTFSMFQERLEQAGARTFCCDDYLPPKTPDTDKKIGKDFAALIEMAADTTINLDQKVCMELEEIKPDCIVSDSLCFWGKLFAKKLHIPYICSTTSFAFNQFTAKLMKRSISEIVRMLFGMPRINQKIQNLQANGYAVKSFIDIVQNDNETNTIVYTSKEFQPLSDTFSDRYAFVGPALPKLSNEQNKKYSVYISLGTVNNRNRQFYQNCMKALKDSNRNVLISIGENTKISDFGEIPKHITIKNSVNQIEILSHAEVFLTHGGMNSVNESLYFGVPMVLFPQQSEQGLVARRTAVLGTGILLNNSRPRSIQKALYQVLGNSSYKGHAKQLSDGLHHAGGAAAAADFILNLINEA